MSRTRALTAVPRSRALTAKSSIPAFPTPCSASQSATQALAWKFDVGNRLKKTYAAGTAGHALGFALTTMATLRIPDGTLAIASILQIGSNQRYLLSTKATDMFVLQYQESIAHRNQTSEDYTTDISWVLRAMSPWHRSLLHIATAKVFGGWEILRRVAMPMNRG